eukprot:7455293-Lingulodinium_polyedra.AAC.1
MMFAPRSSSARCRTRTRSRSAARTSSTTAPTSTTAGTRSPLAGHGVRVRPRPELQAPSACARTGRSGARLSRGACGWPTA